MCAGNILFLIHLLSIVTQSLPFPLLMTCLEDPNLLNILLAGLLHTCQWKTIASINRAIHWTPPFSAVMQNPCYFPDQYRDSFPKFFLTPPLSHTLKNFFFFLFWHGFYLSNLSPTSFLTSLTSGIYTLFLYNELA